MMDIEERVLKDQILQVKEWTRETARRVEYIEPSQAPSWEFLNLAIQAQQIADSAYSIARKLYAIEREGGKNGQA